ncbi:hypothetical protein [Actinacidiphila rubida]|uniref:Uncharacterized protein n=1 Tax=Actinacidiphila rubida TaxID=310780 RepID=A0A1H8IMF9_9ACTN|nr:hypothetical protein [Actinacidiphila rubida]SEN68828.1 hypothetical protein SAMN05216267_1008117 [Actinacidiphila rubida]
MAKNKNNQNRQREQHDHRSDPATEAQEPVKTAVGGEEHGMPAATPVARKQQKRFGHN